MVVQYISCVSYGSNFRFRLPRRARDDSVRGYEIFRDEGIVKCFCCDEKDVRGCDLNRWIVPSGAREMEFVEMDFHGEKKIGWPVYYNDKDEIIQEGNH